MKIPARLEPADVHPPASALSQERERIARLLHDGPCQSLNALQFAVQHALKGTDGSFKEGGKVKSLVNAALDEMHGVLRALRDPAEIQAAPAGFAAEAPRATYEEPTKKSPATLHRIFILDDHRMVREGLRAIIEKEDDLSVCGEAATAAEAISLIPKLQPDVVLADISLPGANGVEFLKHLKALHPELITIIVSMHDESVYAERALQAGARGYVVKRAAIEEVIGAIRAAVAGDCYVSKTVNGALFHKDLSLTGEGKRASDSPAAVLSDRELEVFELLGRGKSTRQIAEALHLSVKTIETHRAHIKEKCRLNSNAEMIQQAAVWVEHSCTV